MLGHYTSPADLADQVVRALEHDLKTEGWTEEAAQHARLKQGGAQLRWAHRRDREQAGVDPKGKVKYRTTRNELVVNNEGAMAAERLTFTLEPIGETHFRFDQIEETFDLSPGSQMAWLLIPLSGSGRNVRVTAQWYEGNQKGRLLDRRPRQVKLELLGRVFQHPAFTMGLIDSPAENDPDYVLEFPD